MVNFSESFNLCMGACVRTANGMTSYFPCSIGTRQGCVSSSLLFSLFINDLATRLREQCGSGIFVSNRIPDILCLMFADDIANCAETAVKLKQQINTVDLFCRNTGMQVNIEKTKILFSEMGDHYEITKNGPTAGHLLKWYLSIDIWVSYSRQNLNGPAQNLH